MCAVKYLNKEKNLSMYIQEIKCMYIKQQSQIQELYRESGLFLSADISGRGERI